MSDFGEGTPESSRTPVKPPKRRRLGSDSEERNDQEGETIQECYKEGKDEVMEQLDDDYPSDGPGISDEDYRRLIRKAFKDTIAMYKRLQEVQQLPEDLCVQDFNPAKTYAKFMKIMSEEDCQRRLKHWMQYDFAGPCCPSRFSTFLALQIRRHPENGRRVIPNEYDRAYGYNKCAEAAVQYVKLWQHMHDHLKEPVPSMQLSDNRRIWEHKLWSEMKLRMLNITDVSICSVEVIRRRHEHTYKEVHELCCYLCGNERDIHADIHDRKSLWKVVQEKFSHIDEKCFNEIMDDLCPPGKECSPENHVGELSNLEWSYSTIANMRHPTLGEYYTLKVQKATELGLVKTNQEGILVDNFDVSEWKID